MKQHHIDLLPDSIRVQGQAGMEAGRTAVAVVVIAIFLVVLITHAKMRLNSAQERLEIAEAENNLVIAAETKAALLREELSEMRRFVERYDRIAFPLEMSRVVSTVVNALPETISLDRLDLDAGAQRTGLAPRKPDRGKPEKGKPPADDTPPRVLRGELTGFATSDSEIAELVNRLTANPPLSEVTLDFSRSRLVRGISAREFRLSFRIDLEPVYEVVEPIVNFADAAQPAMQEQ